MQNILYRSDCKEALEKLINEGVRVDLIYLDPPFNSSRIYNMIYSGGHGKAATQKAFYDMWSLTSQNYQMVLQFEAILDGLPDISQLVKDFLKTWIAPLKNGTVQDQKMVIYLIYMTQRLNSYEADTEAYRVYLLSLRSHGQPLYQDPHGWHFREKEF